MWELLLLGPDKIYFLLINVPLVRGCDLMGVVDLTGEEEGVWQGADSIIITSSPSPSLSPLLNEVSTGDSEFRKSK